MQSTDNLNQFRVLRGNRPLNPAHLRKLETSIAERNLLAHNPIIVNRENEVIDGQHRLQVAKSLNLPIYYTIIDGGAEETKILNANNRGWNTHDFLESYVAQGSKPYKVLKDFSEKYGFTISLSLQLLLGGKPGKLMEDFKNGLFDIGDLEDAHRMAQVLKSFEPYTEYGVIRDREFVQALKFADESVPIEMLAEKAAKIRTKIPRKARTRDYLFELEALYNVRKSEENKKRFF